MLHSHATLMADTALKHKARITDEHSDNGAGVSNPVEAYGPLTCVIPGLSTR